MEYEILFLAPFPPHKGGISYYSKQFLIEAPKNLNITKIGFKRVFPKILYPGDSLKNLKFEDNIPLKIDNLNPFSWNYLSKLNLKESGFFILPYWTSTLALQFYFISRFFKKKYPKWKFILWCHNVKDHKPFPFFEILKNLLFKRADAFIVHSKKSFKEIEKFKKPILLSFLPLHKIPHNLIEKKIARERLNLKEEDKVVLFFGTIRKYKGVEELIEIGKLLKEENIKIIVAGDLWRECRKFKKEFENLNFLTFFGFHNWEKVIDFFSSADLLIMPYKNASGSGILMMAYYFKIPFCISYLEEFEEYLPEDYPILKNNKQMSDFILEYFMREEMREKLKKCIENKRKEFTWDLFFKRFLEFIEQKV